MIGEINDHIRLIDAVREPVADHGAGSAQPQRMSDVPADNGMSRHFNGADHPNIFHGRNQADDASAHFSACTGHNDFNHDTTP